MSRRKYRAFECIEFVGKDVKFKVFSEYVGDMKITGVFTSFDLLVIKFKTDDGISYTFNLNTWAGNTYYFVKTGPLLPINYRGEDEVLNVK